MSSHRHRLFSLLLGLCLIEPAFGQDSASDRQYVLNRWTSEHGLPQNTINKILQTRDGYLWMTTFDGAVRFDGVRFSVFNRQTMPGFPNDRTSSLYEDREGTLWIGTEGGLVRYADGEFTTITQADGLPGDRIHTIAEMLKASCGSAFSVRRAAAWST